MEVTLKIFRYNPEVDQKFHYETYTIEAEETERILDLLEYVKGYHDGTHSFRRSCAHGVCGSDAMRINGRNALACKVLVKDLGGDQITVEPLLGLKVERDLIVDMEPFFNQYKGKLEFVGMAVQEPTLTYKNDKTGKPFTKDEFTAFATDYLGVDAIFWSVETPWLKQ